MTKKKALIFFCEGAHDVAFLSKILTEIFLSKQVALKFSEYPAPFNSYFKTQVESHAQKDLSLDMAHKFFLPDVVFENEDKVILLFNTGGKNNTDKVKELLTTLLPLLNIAMTFQENAKSVIVETKFLFLYDSDESMAIEIQEKWHQDFKKIDEEMWLGSCITISPDNLMAATSTDSKAVYVWAESGKKGTLEDLLLPIFEAHSVDSSDKSKNTLNTMFQWAKNGAHQTVAENAKFKKSVITLMGQGKKPGASMNVIVSQSGIVTKELIARSQVTMNFCNFFATFSGITYTL